MADSTGVSSEISSKLANLDVTKLTPLSPEVICKQATINIGTIGHVAHGKSTVVKALSGVQTVRFKNELERNITIKLGEVEKRGEQEVDSTMIGADEDEDLQVLAEINRSVDSYNNGSEMLDSDFLDSPSRPSVIRHSMLVDNAVKRSLKQEFEDAKASSTTEDQMPSTPESVDSDKVKNIAKKKPGPKSKTQVQEEIVVETKKKPGPKSKTQTKISEYYKSPDIPNRSISPDLFAAEDEEVVKKKPGPKSQTEVMQDSVVKKKPGPRSKTMVQEEPTSQVEEPKRKPGPRSKTQVRETEIEIKKKPGPKSKTEPKPKKDSESETEIEPKTVVTPSKPGVKSKAKSKLQDDSDSETTHKAETKSVVSPSKSGPKSKVVKDPESDTEKSPEQKEEKMDVDENESDDSMHHFEAPQPKSYSTRGGKATSTPINNAETRSLRTKSERKSYRSYSSDEESKPVIKKRRTMSTESKDSQGKVVEKKKKVTKKDTSYRSRRLSKKKRKSTKDNDEIRGVNRDTPSETRVVEPGSQVDMSVGRQDDGEYEVETVLESRMSEGRQYYKIKWRGWPEEYNTWEPMEFLVHSQESLLEYFQSEPKRSQERLAKLASQIDGLEALTGRFADYERDVVGELKKEDFNNIDCTFKNGFTDSFPSHKLLCLHISKCLKNKDKELEVKIRHFIAVREAIRLRYEQLTLLKEWEKDMINKSNQREATLCVENNVDLEGPPLNFHFKNANVQGEGVEIPDDPFIGCECTNCEDGVSCCGAQSESKFAYTADGLLKVEHGTPVYECNKRCKCSKTCANRVVQNGRTVKVCIFRTPNNIGWGVKAMEDIPQGKFVCEYIGEVVKREVADERIKNEYKGRSLYIFDLDFNDSKEFPYTVDAYQYGNVSHFINHACEPNLAVYSVWIDCLDPNLPRLAMFAIRDIREGEELAFDYSAQYHRKRKSQANKKEQSNTRRTDQTTCRCGSGSCRQVIF